ncbi:MAG TPA: sterol desaturase family protein [Polyangiaceae bacterium]|nr:sterol desaturase family protein [Polyangiaceae bacterium]
MSLDDLAPLFILGFFAVGFVLERVCAARPLQRVRGWWLRGALFFVSTMALNALVPMWVAERLSGFSPLRLSNLGTLAGGALTLVCTDLISYWLHRIQHRSPTLWRWTHQIHHSAERVDVLGAAYFHPFDIALQALLSTIVVVALGVSANAAALGGIATVFLAVFQHLNVRTPVWLGYLVQRPEGHSVHHARGVHAYNYGNLGLWDLVFGTFRNPAQFSAEAGFFEGASGRVWPMLLGRDIQR